MSGAGRGWRFKLEDVVRQLPHLNASSVRTHVGSRCCVNAPRHHAHAWPYFKRVARGAYEILPEYRAAPLTSSRPKRVVAESGVAYRPDGPDKRGTVHAVVVRDKDWYVAECIEIAVVTQGRTLDEVSAALREAVGLHLEGEDLDALGLVKSPRLVVQYETSVR